MENQIEYLAGLGKKISKEFLFNHDDVVLVLRTRLETTITRDGINWMARVLEFDTKGATEQDVFNSADEYEKLLGHPDNLFLLDKDYFFDLGGKEYNLQIEYE